MSKLSIALLFIFLLNYSFSQNFYEEVKKFEGQRIKKLVNYLNLHSVDTSTANYICIFYRDRKTLSRISIRICHTNTSEIITLHFKPTKIKSNNPYCLCDIRIRMRRIIKIDHFAIDLSD